MSLVNVSLGAGTGAPGPYIPLSSCPNHICAGGPGALLLNPSLPFDSGTQFSFSVGEGKGQGSGSGGGYTSILPSNGPEAIAGGGGAGSNVNFGLAGGTNSLASYTCTVQNAQVTCQGQLMAQLSNSRNGLVDRSGSGGAGGKL